MGPTVAAPFWNDGKSYIFDPWSGRRGATTIHDHGHTRWAESIFDNWAAGNFSKGARFDWAGETVYIVGRGASLDSSARLLNKKGRKSPAIVLNHACCNERLKVKPQDFVMVVDDRAENTITGDVSNLNLIGSPALKRSFVEKGWNEVYGITMWPNAPLNNFMRKLFPELPQVNEMLSVSITAMHLAAMNGAKNIVLVAHDHTHEDGELNFTWENGNTVKTTAYLAKLSHAIGVMAYYIKEHTGAEVLNCSNGGIVGYSMMAKGAVKKVEYIKQAKLSKNIQ